MNRQANLLVLREQDIKKALYGQELAVVDAVAAAYLSHRAGKTVLPHSIFLNPNPLRTSDRIIALPAALNDDAPFIGMKWIASFPKNPDRGLARASAVLVVNCPETGRPVAILESSLISSSRTAASAALAAKALHQGDRSRVGVIGCGVINYEVVRYIKALNEELNQLWLYDILPERAYEFAANISEFMPEITCHIVQNIQSIIDQACLVSLATVAATPHIAAPVNWPSELTLLHVSLRDLSPDCIVSADNVVDDVDHVLRAATSLDLARNAFGHHDFIRCTLADILVGAAPARVSNRPVIFSPFGLGILDLAVARLVLKNNYGQIGVEIRDFLGGSTA